MKLYRGGFVKKIVFALTSFFFSLFWCMKCFGYFDFTSKYSLKRIESSVNVNNLPLLLDGQVAHNLLSAWGGNFNEGDWLLLRFKKKVSVRSMDLYFVNDKLPKSPTFLFFTNQDGWKEALSVRETRGQVDSFSFEQDTESIIAMKIVINSKVDNWGISELRINEKRN